MLDPQLSVAGLGVGFLVGLTGMGGGALMTPLLILVFGVPPLAAVSSDLVTSLVMKPVGGLVHMRRRTIDWRLVRLLSAGSVPAALTGVLALELLGNGTALQDKLKTLIGVVLLFSLVATIVSGFVSRGSTLHERPALRPVRVVTIGVIGGLCVGMTSVGAGSVVIALLLVTHPGMRASQLVGSDLVQAIPLVAAATAGHLVFGDVRAAISLALVIGAVPGVYLGARLSSRAPAGVLKPVIMTVLLASGLALLHVTTSVLLGVTGSWLVVRLLVAGVAGLRRRTRTLVPLSS